MDKDFLKGLKISFGFIFGLSLFLGIVFAVGFHSADEILAGVFQGNYTFNGSININGNVTFSDGTSLNSSQYITFDYPKWRTYSLTNTYAFSTTSGSWTTSTDNIYLSGTSYTGGFLGWALSSQGITNPNTKKWYVDFEANKDGINSPPYPQYLFGLTNKTTIADYQTNTNTKIYAMIGNAYSFNYYLNNVNLITQSGSTWAYGGRKFRFNYTGNNTLYFMGSTDGGSTWSNIHINDSFDPGTATLYPAMVGRSDSDGWRNMVLNYWQ